MIAGRNQAIAVKLFTLLNQVRSIVSDWIAELNIYLLGAAFNRPLK